MFFTAHFPNQAEAVNKNYISTCLHIGTEKFSNLRFSRSHPVAQWLQFRVSVRKRMAFSFHRYSIVSFSSYNPLFFSPFQRRQEGKDLLSRTSNLADLSFTLVNSSSLIQFFFYCKRVFNKLNIKNIHVAMSFCYLTSLSVQSSFLALLDQIRS